VSSFLGDHICAEQLRKYQKPPGRSGESKEGNNMSNKMNDKAPEIGKEEEILGVTPTAQTSASHKSAPPDFVERIGLMDREAIDELKYTLKTRLRRGRDRPLAKLARAEAELQTRSAALAKLSNVPQKKPDKRLLVHQLVRTVDTSCAPRTFAPELRNDVVGLYSSLQSGDPIESILDRLIVGMLNNVMACHARAAQTYDPRALDVNLRHAEKGSKAIVDLVQTRERRRNPNGLVVGSVNVEAGGQAILANVETLNSHSENETQSEPRSRSRSGRRCGDK
jgi:hypothetical protein